MLHVLMADLLHTVALSPSASLFNREHIDYRLRAIEADFGHRCGVSPGRIAL